MRRRGRKDGDAPRRPFLRPLPLLCLLLLATGCRSNKSNLVEAELRTKEREVRNLRSELDRAETFNSALQYELMGRPTGCSASPVPPMGGVIDGPQSVMSGTVKTITLGRGTGGVDDDGLPGDEALQVVIVPQDTDGSALKVPGNAVVLSYEITPEGLKVPLNRWEVSSSQLQRSWRSGLFTTGYFVSLPWKSWPSNEKMRVVVQFATLPNNRPFEAEKDIHVKVVPGSSRRDVAPTAPVVMPPAPSPEAAPPAAEGPLLTPGAWLRERAPSFVESAKRSGESRQPVRLLDPRMPPDE